MHMLALSQKQKTGVFLVILTLGFVILGVFTASRLNGLSHQYELSANVSQGTVSLLQLQSDILILASQLKSVTNEQLDDTKQSITDIAKAVTVDAQFLQRVSLADFAAQLTKSVDQFEQAVSPWLSLKSELGFSVDSGKLGELKRLASVIESKIAETGMVTINSDFQAMIKAQQTYLLQPNEQNLTLFNRALAGFVTMSNTYAMLDLYQQEIDQFKSTFERVSVLSQQVEASEQQMLSTESQMKAVVANASQALETLSHSYTDVAQQDAQHTVWSVLFACAVLAVFAVTSSALLGAQQRRALLQTNQVMQAVSAGDLSQRMVVGRNSKDEFNQLALTINTSCEKLGQLVHQVQDSSSALSDNASELNAGLDRLSKGQSELLGQSQMLASATEQVSVTTQEVSGSLEFVAEISRSSTLAANDGSQIIATAIQSIEDIGQVLESAAAHISQLEEASSKIDSVMDIINGVAEQTNLLALNAAIEAARAGEQGRGFAVVADEVRSLAVRTVSAVEDISGTVDQMKNESAAVIEAISQSERSMMLGRERGQAAMSAMSGITEKADEAAQKTQDIFDAIKELASTSQSMADNMTQISSAMQTLGENNSQLKAVSDLVNHRSSGLSDDCQKFIV